MVHASYSASQTVGQIEGPYIPTRGEAKFVSGESALAGYAMMFDRFDNTAGDSFFWLKNYDDDTGVSGVWAIATENRPASGMITGDDDYAGVSWYNRNIKGLVHGGPIGMLYVTGGANTDRLTRTNDIAAPHPSGFQLWTAGMTKLGRVVQAGVPTGMGAMIYIDIEDYANQGA